MNYKRASFMINSFYMHKNLEKEHCETVGYNIWDSNLLIEFKQQSKNQQTRANTRPRIWLVKRRSSWWLFTISNTLFMSVRASGTHKHRQAEWYKQRKIWRFIVVLFVGYIVWHSSWRHESHINHLFSDSFSNESLLCFSETFPCGLFWICFH